MVQTIFNICRWGEGGQNIFSIFRGVQKNSRNLGRGGGGKSFMFREGYEEIDKKCPENILKGWSTRYVLAFRGVFILFPKFRGEGGGCKGFTAFAPPGCF